MTVLKDLPLTKVELDYPFERSWAPEPGKPFEVAPDVFWLRMPIPISLDHINLWLLKDGDGWVIVDSGVDDPSCKAVWETVFATFCSVEQVNKIIVTHFHMDHIGLASWLALKCDCDVYMTQGEFDRYHSIVTRDEDAFSKEARSHFHSLGFDQAAVDATGRFFKVDEKPVEARVQPEQVNFIAEGDEIEIGNRCWKVVCGNGHSPEHACLYDEKNQVLISGDQSLPRISSNVSVYPGNMETNPLADWLSSCEKLRDLIPATALVLPSHQEPFKQNPTRMQQLIDEHYRQLDFLLSALETQMNTIQAKKCLFDRKLDPVQNLLAIGETLAHLRFLVAAGDIEEHLDKNNIACFKRKD